METNIAAPTAPAPVATSTPAPAPIAAPVAAPAPAAPTPFAVRPLIDTAGKNVNPLGKPVAEPAAQDEVSFDDLDKAPAKPEPTPEPTPDPKAAAKSEEAKVNPFEVAEQKKRDYSDLSPEDEALARKLPNKLHDLFRSRLGQFKVELDKRDQELAAARNTAAKFTHDHPEAYRLDPQFNEAVSEYEAIRAEQDFYTEQLVKAQAGEDWAYIKGFDANGAPVLENVSANGRVNAQHIAQLNRAINGLAQKEQSTQAKAAQIRNAYSNSVTEVQQHYKSAREKLFPNIAPEKLEGQEKEIFDLVIQSLPIVERQRPSAQMQALAAVVVMRANNIAKAALERAERAERIAGTATAAAPINPASQPAIIAKPGDVINWAEFDGPTR